ncbi:MAG: DUF131 domain-containing protein [Thermoplasmata archaeon]|nr:DUF131 domain-containing protein [Thermoplasmata archaeon]
MANRLPMALFILGVAFIIASFIFGEAKAGLFIIFPFIYGTGFFMLAGILLIFISMILFMFSFPLEYDGSKEYVEERKGGIVMIGPIPIIIASDKNMALLLLIISIIFIFIFLAFLFVKI